MVRPPHSYLRRAPCTLLRRPRIARGHCSHNGGATAQHVFLTVVRDDAETSAAAAAQRDALGDGEATAGAAAGEAAAPLALTGEAPPWLDEEVFAPTRLAAR